MINSKILKTYLVGIEKIHLGTGFNFYNIDGNFLFENRGAGGGMVSSRILYIIPSNIELYNPRKVPYYAVTINNDKTIEEINTIIDIAISDFIFLLSQGNSNKVDLISGEFI